ncbi:MAG: dienelactone hydrolase family protein [Anaerolineae bacterium]|nr:dienelactone hydrolase family protein [Anaerolineae bacterium]
MTDYNPTLPKQRDGVTWAGPDDEATKKSGLIHFAYVPPNAGPNRRVPVLLMLHGFGGNERQMWDYVSGLPQNLAIVSPRAPNTAKGEGTGRFSWGTNQAPLIKFVDALPDLYPVDPNRVYVAGFSEGAVLGSKYTLSHERIAGLAMFSGKLGMQPAGKVKTPVFIAHGKGDDTIPVSHAHEAREALGEAGAEVTAKDYGGKHYTTDQAKADFVSWVRSQLAGSTKAAILDELLRLEALKATITSPAGTYHDTATGKFASKPGGGRSGGELNRMDQKTPAEMSKLGQRIATLFKSNDQANGWSRMKGIGGKLFSKTQGAFTSIVYQSEQGETQGKWVSRLVKEGAGEIVTQTHNRQAAAFAFAEWKLATQKQK